MSSSCVAVILLVGLFQYTHKKVRCHVHSGRGVDNVCDAKSRGRCCRCLLTRCTAFLHARDGALTRKVIRVCEKRKGENRSEHKESLEIEALFDKTRASDPAP